MFGTGLALASLTLAAATGGTFLEGTAGTASTESPTEEGEG